MDYFEIACGLARGLQSSAETESMAPEGRRCRICGRPALSPNSHGKYVWMDGHDLCARHWQSILDKAREVVK